MYPKLIVNMNKLKENIDAVAKLTKDDAGCSLMIVTKGVCADDKITDMIAAHPRVDFMADSRTANLAKYHAKANAAGKLTVLMRLPMLCEIEEVVKYADVSFNSEMETLAALNEAAKAGDKKHKVVLMIDMGDLREGMFFKNEEEIFSTAEAVLGMSNLELFGVGVNLTCYGAIIPKQDNLSQLADFARRIEDKLGVKLPVVSGGNSSSIYLTWKGGLPEGISNLRLGESFLLGNDTAYGETCPGTVHDTLIVEAQIVELKEKPSIPIGEVGRDAFGNVPEYEDRGVIKRAILAIGKQDTDIGGMIPVKQGAGGNWIDDTSIDILGGSSDHTLMDLTNADRDYRVGDTICFRLEYGAMLAVATSPYVEKEYR